MFPCRLRPALTLAVALAIPATAPAQTPRPPDAPTALAEARLDWKAERLDGSVVRLDSLRGRVLVLNLWATWCRPCRAELPALEALRDSLAGEVEFLALSPEAAEPVRAFVARHGVRLPVALELEEPPEPLRASALPTTWIIDRSGAVVLEHRGAADWNIPEMRRFLRLLARDGTAGSAR